jgi:hypothetical protein
MRYIFFIFVLLLLLHCGCRSASNLELQAGERRIFGGLGGALQKAEHAGTRRRARLQPGGIVEVGEDSAESVFSRPLTSYSSFPPCADLTFAG